MEDKMEKSNRTKGQLEQYSQFYDNIKIKMKNYIIKWKEEEEEGLQ